MIYMGSKNRISKELSKIIQSYINKDTKLYIEPFVGGGNMIDKIEHSHKIGSDIDKYVIAVLNGLKDGEIPPYEVSKDFYYEVKKNKDNYSDFLVGYIGYELSFGAKWFGGYAKRDDKKSRGDIYSYKSCLKQAEKLKDTEFKTCSFNEYINLKNCLIYCDPPYENTTKYKYDFNYNDYWDWVRKLSKDNVVLCSEYDAPDDFECIWSKEIKITLKKNSNNNKKSIEKLFKYKGGL